jgi:membrane associated rhomboid family serine protease
MTHGNPPDPVGSQVVPHCYRHPDRETYISCQRCGRPICPDCMRSASVGFQCPECVKEGRATQRQPRTAFGGIVRNPGVVTNTLIALNVAVLVLIHASGGDRGSGSVWLERLEQRNWYPFHSVAGQHIDSVAGGSYWQLVTATFTHVGVSHILLNMVSLWIVGTQLELLLGWWRYLSVYLLSGLAGGVAVYWLAAPESAAIGASGAIFGIFGCLIVLALRLQANIGQMLAILGLNLVFSFTIPGISWQGHVGGLIAGLILGAGVAFTPRAARRWAYPAIFAAILVACVIAVVVRTQMLPAVT